MKRMILSILLSLLAANVYGQQNDFNLKKIKFRGFGFSTPKETIIKSLGQPEIVHTDYDCGFYANDQPGGPYYQLKYAHFNFIGSDKEPFFLENLDFDSGGKLRLHYGEIELTGFTTRNDFIKIFGDAAKKYFDEHPDSDAIILVSTDSDDGARFTFQNNALVQYQYWSPC